eukprot:Phypoly_transcript_07358.p1 GENE.Phypoly_transcript_07358~~Phypoly_transcript_07358.p1  ORF type:complete len:498 (+),score=83.95 Phypoly_transcript_07358:145-1638(+)
MYDYEGATENDPLLQATTIKYEQRYNHQGVVLRRSIFLFLVSLGFILVFDIARMILRRNSYDPDNGNMIPQVIMVVMVGAFAFVFTKREKTTLLVVVYITVLVLFLLFSLAILPSFIKEIIIDYDVLCPVLIGLTGTNALICIFCISRAYVFLKFHRKYTKRKANLPAAVLHSSPMWHPKRQEDDLASVLFPSPQFDSKAIQEKWEKFQQSRLYLPENKPSPRPVQRPVPPLSLSGHSPPGPIPAPGQLTAQERWERFQRSPIFAVNNKNPPQIGRARRNTLKEKSSVSRKSVPPPTPSPPVPSPSPPPAPSLVPSHAPTPSDPPAQPTDVHTHTSTSSRTRAPLERNPSFRYGAYLHEPTQLRAAQPDDTPQEYTRLTQSSRGDSLPNILDAQPPFELESYSARDVDEEARRERRRSLRQSGNYTQLRASVDAGEGGSDGTRAVNEEMRREIRLSQRQSSSQARNRDLIINSTYVDSPRASEVVQPYLRPKMDVIE